MRLLPLLLCTLLGACVRSPEPSHSNKIVARFALASELPSFSPLNPGQSTYQVLQRQIFETLTEYQPDAFPFRIKPLLAERWTTSTDGLTWNFFIREDAEFYDPWPTPLWPSRRHPLTAHDVMASWSLQKEQGQGGWAIQEIVQEMTVVDDHQVQITLHHPDAHLLEKLASAYFAVFPVHALRLSRRPFSRFPIGSGPYFLKEGIPGHEAVFEKTPEWRTSIVGPDEIRFTAMLEGSTRTLLFQQGKLDRLSPGQDAFASMLPGGILDPSWSEEGFRTQTITMPDLTMFSFQMNDAVVGNIPGDRKGNAQRKKIRHAIALAFPYERWHRILRNDLWAVPAKAFLPPSLPSAQNIPDCSWRKTDLAQAKALLAEAGFPEGKGLPTLTFELAGADSLTRTQGDLVVNALQAIEIRCVAVPNTWSAFQEKARQGKAQLFSRGWTLDWADASNLLFLFSSQEIGSLNLNFFSDETYDRLLKELPEQSPQDQQETLQKLISILNEELPAIPIDHRQGWAVLGPRVIEMPIHPFDPYACKYYRLKP